MVKKFYNFREANCAVGNTGDTELFYPVPTDANRRHLIAGGVAWSYNCVPGEEDAAVVNGALQIYTGPVDAPDAYLVLDVAIADLGAGFIPLPGMAADMGQSLKIVLLEGGTGLTRKITVLGHELI